MYKYVPQFREIKMYHRGTYNRYSHQAVQTVNVIIEESTNITPILHVLMQNQTNVVLKQ